MKLWIAGWWEDLRANFWFLPTLMVIAAIALSLGTIHLDHAYSDTNVIAALGWTFTRGPEGSRAVMSTLAGSMMTITSVSFSITIVALQLASSQFGPRLLRNFMKDRGNQVALGTFIATFCYCLLILRTINGTDDQPFVPHISVTVGLGLALLSVGVLIFFIHHSAESIQAENVISAVSRDLLGAIDDLYPKGAGRGSVRLSSGYRQKFLGHSRGEGRPIAVPESNYLRAIDVESLLGLAEEKDLLIRIEQRPGKFLLRDEEIAWVTPVDRVDDETAKLIASAFFFGRRRSLSQDVEFAIEQLVEIASRALSPGINDPFTAINCIERLGEALRDLAGREIPSPYRHDDAGRLRVMTRASTVGGIVDAAFHPIRQAAFGQVSVTIRLLETIAAVARHTEDPEFLRALHRHADAIHRGYERDLDDRLDRADARERYDEVMAILAKSRPDALEAERENEDS